MEALAGIWLFLLLVWLVVAVAWIILPSLVLRLITRTNDVVEQQAKQLGYLRTIAAAAQVTISRRDREEGGAFERTPDEPAKPQPWRHIQINR